MCRSGNNTPSLKTVFSFAIIMVLTYVITSPIHELGHVIATLMFKPDSK